MERRAFLGKLGLGMGVTAFGKSPDLVNPASRSIRFGIVADVHHTMIPDTIDRLLEFIERAIDLDVDFIIQLGDFCHYQDSSKPFLNVWRQFPKGKYHVLGNHDMDLNSKQEIMGMWEMPGKYYTFEELGVRFIVLDANYLYIDGEFKDYDNANFYISDKFRTYIDQAQLEWFEGEVSSSTLPVIVLSHQSLWHYQSGIKNRLAVQRIMENYASKILCCFNGHNHIDFFHKQNGINYISVNSMSYQWMGDEYKVSRYPSRMLSEFKWLDHLAPYNEPLYAFVDLEPNEKLEVKGTTSTWMLPSPHDAGFPEQALGNRISPKISNYSISLK
jgi:hypothetical protein